MERGELASVEIWILICAYLQNVIGYFFMLGGKWKVLSVVSKEENNTNKTLTRSIFSPPFDNCIRNKTIQIKLNI